MAESTRTVNNLQLSDDASAEEKTALGLLAAVISQCPDWYVVGAASSHLALVMLAVLAKKGILKELP